MRLAAKSAIVLGGLSSMACAQAVNFTINATSNVKPISRLIYGVNGAIAGYTDPTLLRLGGNRWTAYNWVTNASNAGSDYLYENDDYLSSSTVPGAAVTPTIQQAYADDAGTLVTIPMAGYVSADEAGPVNINDPNRFTTRFKPEEPVDPNPFSLAPSPNAPAVYADEFVNWVNTEYPYGATDPNRPISFELDNEPDLWSSTHAEVHPAATTYAELINDTIAYSTAIKNVDPNALVYGPVSYGWEGFVSLQNAPDSAADGNFINYYLKQLNAASQKAGKRLLDVLDLHWYPEATGINASGVATRITNDDNSPGVVAARLQAPRSLWDPTYVETSWITQSLGNQAIDLLPRTQGQINANYAGTKISISEYNYGGGDNISGGLAEADVLGIYGEQGVYSANEWPLISNEDFIGAAFNMYRNYDGHGSTFGDTSVSASTNNVTNTSIYASTDSTNPDHMVTVAINKNPSPETATFALTNGKNFQIAEIFQLTAASPNPVFAGQIILSSPTSMTYTMPGYSVSTLDILAPVGAGDCNSDGTVNLSDLLTVLNYYGDTGTYWGEGDFNNDGTTNLTDLLALLNNYGEGSTGASTLTTQTTAVPEPAALSMIALAATGLLSRRRRK